MSGLGSRWFVRFLDRRATWCRRFGWRVFWMRSVRIMRVSARATDGAKAASVAEIFGTRYVDFQIKHVNEQIMGVPMASGTPFRRSYTWTRNVLQFRGLTTKAPRRGVHRRRRERRPFPGIAKAPATPAAA